jgi:hypothetical protein
MNPQNYESLNVLFNTTNGLNWNWGSPNKSTHWNFPSQPNYTIPCSVPWEGVVCDMNGNLVQLVLPKHNLTGFLPTMISSFVSLKTLQLQNNFLSGSIPIEISTLVQLSELDLSDTKFKYNIPTELTAQQNITSKFKEAFDNAS